MTDPEKALVNEECFGEDFIDDVGEDVGVEDDLAQCLVDVLGYMPSGPDALNNEKKILVARECFGQDISEGRPSRDEVRNDPCMTLVTMAATEVLETGTVVLIGILAAVTAVVTATPRL